jgi:hypothetical protein
MPNQDLVTWAQFVEKWDSRLQGQDGEDRDAVHFALRQTEFNGNAAHRKQAFLHHLKGENGTLASNARREAENYLPF